MARLRAVLGAKEWVDHPQGLAVAVATSAVVIQSRACNSERHDCYPIEKWSGVK